MSSSSQVMPSARISRSALPLVRVPVANPGRVKPEDVAARAALAVHRLRGDDQRVGRVEPAGDPDDELRVARSPAAAAPGPRPGCCRPRSSPAPAGRVGRHEREPLHARAAARGRRRAGRAGTRRSGSASVRSAKARRLSSKVPIRSRSAAAGRGRRRRPSAAAPFGNRSVSASRLAVLPDHRLAVPRQVGGRLALAGRRVDVRRQAARRRRPGQQARDLRPPDGDRAARQVRQHRRPGQRRLGARRHRHPHVLADLDVQDEPGHVLGGEEQVRPERHLGAGQADRAAQVVARRDLAALVELPVGRQVRLRRDAEQPPAVHDRGDVVDPVAAADRQRRPRAPAAGPPSPRRPRPAPPRPRRAGCPAGGCPRSSSRSASAPGRRRARRPRRRTRAPSRSTAAALAAGSAMTVRSVAAATRRKPCRYGERKSGLSGMAETAVPSGRRAAWTAVCPRAAPRSCGKRRSGVPTALPREARRPRGPGTTSRWHPERCRLAAAKVPTRGGVGAERRPTAGAGALACWRRASQSSDRSCPAPRRGADGPGRLHAPAPAEIAVPSSGPAPTAAPASVDAVPPGLGRFYAQTLSWGPCAPFAGPDDRAAFADEALRLRPAGGPARLRRRPRAAPPSSACCASRRPATRSGRS